jgi:N-succinyldiaminopimelate aminotransferase
MNPIFADLETSVFEAMSRLARERQAINLGQGFPDDPGPADVRAKAGEAVVNGWNQYPPMMGLPELREAVASHYRRFQGLDLDPTSEIMITSGATEALAGALLALIEPGDEVVLFQPMYDAYLPLVRRAGGAPRFVTLRPPDWSFSEADLAAAFSERTRVVLFNNPLNPAGVVYDRAALALLARFCVKHDAIALCDEVWEHVVFDGRAHVPLIAMEGMRERTVKIGSAGKIFSLTGWKVGFVSAAPRLMKGLAKAHQFHHLYDAAESAKRRRLWSRQGGFLFRFDARRLSTQPRSLQQRSRRAGLRRLAQRRHLFRQYRHSTARPERRFRLLHMAR